jgi:hypothetical protein
MRFIPGLWIIMDVGRGSEVGYDRRYRNQYEVGRDLANCVKDFESQLVSSIATGQSGGNAEIFDMSWTCKKLATDAEAFSKHVKAVNYIRRFHLIPLAIMATSQKQRLEMVAIDVIRERRNDVHRARRILNTVNKVLTKFIDDHVKSFGANQNPLVRQLASELKANLSPVDAVDMEALDRVYTFGVQDTSLRIERLRTTIPAIDLDEERATELETALMEQAIDDMKAALS